MLRKESRKKKDNKTEESMEVNMTSLIGKKEFLKTRYEESQLYRRKEDCVKSNFSTRV